MKKTNRKFDTKVEKEVAKFLDENLYSKDIFSRCDRTNDRERQLRGSDIIISIPKLNIENAVCDEKAASAYWWLEKSINTFSLEISSFQNGILRDGWIINDNLDTEYYLFCWLNATRKDFTKDDIRWLEYALVRKKDLIQYLESENLTREHILENRDWILHNVKEKGAIGKDKHKDLYFYYSPQLAERPVNIIVKKDVYLKLAILHGEIKMDNR